MTPQQRANEAKWMGLERANRPLTPVEQRARRQADSKARQATDREWCLRNLPDLVQADGWPCSYALLALSDARRHRPAFASRDELVAFVRRVRLARIAATGEDAA